MTNPGLRVKASTCVKPNECGPSHKNPEVKVELFAVMHCVIVLYTYLLLLHDDINLHQRADTPSA